VVETSVSLLERLRNGNDPGSWQRLVDLYTPLIRGWLSRYGLQDTDVDDLVQEVLTVLPRELPAFEHRRAGAFRSWLRIMTVNRLRNFWRARQARPAAIGGSDLNQVLDQLEDPHSDLTRLWDHEHDQHVVRRCLELIEPEFATSTWEAFRRVTLDGTNVDAVAADLGLTPNAVFIAKSRVLSRLRQEVRGLVD
jgi:RNA polymerase sigma factor (sigma-70 family)